MTPSMLLFFCLGLALLVAGAEVLVRGASGIAVRFGVSPLIVGLTIVAMGTSAPEVAVSVHAGFAGEAEIALGNVVGSNICNVLLILGLSALVTPLSVAVQLIRQDVPFMIGASALTFGLAANGLISRFEGAVLLAGLGGYFLFLYRMAYAAGTDMLDSSEVKAREGKLVPDLLRIVAGLVALVVGARWLVDSAVSFATSMGVSKLVIGLTVVAVGTSLPELATSVIAAIRGERDIAVGNVVGSNIFNLLGVLGLASVVSGEGVIVPLSALRFDLPVMVVVAVACLPIFFSGYSISRWEGALFLFYFAVYTGYQVLFATSSANLASLNAAMLYFALPLTGLTLTLIFLGSRRDKPRSENGLP